MARSTIARNNIFAGMIAIVSIFLVSVPAAMADTKTWDGDGGDGLWSNELNWNNDTIPEDGDVVRLDSYAQILMDVNTTLLNNGGIETTPGFGVGFLKIGPSVILTTRSLQLDYGIIENFGTITTPGSALLSDFSLGGSLLNEGTIENAILRLSQDVRLENRTGTIVNSRFRLAAGSDLINTGTLTDASFSFVGDDAKITNDGDISLVRTSTLESATSLLVNTGTITNRGVVKNRGTIDTTTGSIDNRNKIFNECTSSTSTAIPAIFLGVVSGNSVITTCRIFENNNGIGNRLWSDPANWSGGQIPEENDLVVIADVNGEGSSPILDVDFEIRNELIVHEFSILTVDDGNTLTNKGTLTVRGGIINVESGATFRNESEMTFSRVSTDNTGNLANYGTFINTSNARGEFRSGSWFYNAGSSTNQASAYLNNKLLEFAPGSRFENVTTVLNNGDITVSCDVDFRNYGDLLGNRYIGLCKRWDGDAGPADTNWSNPLNWNDNDLPEENDAILIDIPGVVTVDQDVALDSSGSLTTGPGFMPGIMEINEDVELRLNKLNLRGGYVENRGAIISRSSATFVSLEVGALFDNKGYMDKLLADILPGATFNNSLGLVTDSSFELYSNATLSNFETLNDVRISTRQGNGSRIINDGDMTAMRNVFLGSASDYFDNNGFFENFGELYSRGLVEHGGTMLSIGGTIDNAGSFVLECGYVLFGFVEGDPATVESCDVTPPVISTSGPLTFEATSSAGAAIAYSVTANDETDGSVAASCNPANTAVRNLGTYAVSCTAADAAGNVGNLAFDVTVMDTTAPDISAPADIETEATGMTTPVAIGMATADDFYPVTIVSDAPANFPLGTTLVTWTAADSVGNEATAVQSVTVVDTTPPVISVPGAVQVEATAVATTVNLGSASATDIFGVTITNNAPTAFDLGTTVVTWTATDDNGNSSTAIQPVTVVDTTPPDLSVPADIVAEASAIDSIVDPGVATATDIFDVTIVNNAPASYSLGTTVVTWTATDASGNISSADQSITIVDTTPPELTVPSDITVVATGPFMPIDIGAATATDLFAPIDIVNDAPAQFPVGTTLVEWTATDANGNSSSAIQTIEVQYQFDGFMRPLEEGAVFKGGRTLPLKFAISYADGTIVSDATVTFVLIPIYSGDVEGEPLVVESSSSADTGNQFRFSGGKYIFNLRTKGVAAGMYRLVINLDDDSSYLIDIAFK